MSATPLWLVLALALSQTPAQVDEVRKLEKEARELQRDGRYADAEKPLQAAITLWTKYRGPDDVEVLGDTMNLAVAKRRKGDPVAAAALLEKVVEGLGRCKDEDAPGMRRTALNNLAAAYRFSGQVKKAQATWEAVLQQLHGATEGMAGEDRARVLDNLASLLLDDARDVAGAERYARQGYAAWKALRGDGDDPDVAISGSILGSIALRKGDLKEARQRLEEALRVHEVVSGPDNPNVAATLNLLAGLEITAGRHGAARADLKRSLEISRKLKLGPRHYLVVEAQDTLQELDAADAGRK